MLKNEADLRLLERVRAGQPEALEELLARYQAQLYRFGMKMCRDPEDARDVLQETLLAAARGVRDFRGDSSISTWLYAIARSFCIKQRRRSQRAAAALASVEGGAGGAEGLSRAVDVRPTPDQELASRELEQAVDRAIAELDPGYREVLLLRDVEGLTAAEVAEATGLSVQAVKSRLHRARRSVQAALAPVIAPRAPARAGECPELLTAFSEHLEGDLDATRCAEMERHLQGCPRCRHTCDALKRTLRLCRAAGEEAKVPEAVQAEVKQALRGMITGLSPR